MLRTLFRLTLPLLLTMLAVSCADQSASTTEFAHASDAVDAAYAAEAKGEFLKAAEAYAFAILNAPSEEYRMSWEMQRFSALTRAGKQAEAMEAMSRLVDSNRALLTAADLQSLLQECVTAKDARMAEFLVRVAQDGLVPEQSEQFDFELAAATIAGIQNKDDDVLADLGYVLLD